MISSKYSGRRKCSIPVVMKATLSSRCDHVTGRAARRARSRVAPPVQPPARAPRRGDMAEAAHHRPHVEHRRIFADRAVRPCASNERRRRGLESRLPLGGRSERAGMPADDLAERHVARDRLGAAPDRCLELLPGVAAAAGSPRRCPRAARNARGQGRRRASPSSGSARYSAPTPTPARRAMSSTCASRPLSGERVRRGGEKLRAVAPRIGSQWSWRDG